MIHIVLLLYVAATSAFVCGPGYKCAKDPSSSTVWVMPTSGGFTKCSDICSKALANSPKEFYACDASKKTFPNIAAFKTVANLLGFDCKPGGCWNSVSPVPGLNLVSINTGAASGGSKPLKTCYFPQAGSSFSCDAAINNENCFGERYLHVCPCQVRPLASACTWNCPNFPSVATWPKVQDGSCLARINYWRQQACLRGWPECPPSGLPPMVECTACNQCANSQAEFDSKNGAHKSFTRCGDLVQGEGGGANCAAVIDGFVAEREKTGKCDGHCGPILSPGCQTFFFGHYPTNGASTTAGFYTLNWGNCNADKCKSYCANPSSNKCFKTVASPKACGASSATMEEEMESVESFEESDNEVQLANSDEEMDSSSVEYVEQSNEVQLAQSDMQDQQIQGQQEETSTSFGGAVAIGLGVVALVLTVVILALIFRVQSGKVERP